MLKLLSSSKLILDDLNKFYKKKKQNESLNKYHVHSVKLTTSLLSKINKILILSCKDNKDLQKMLFANQSKLCT